jgi:hypothetical protein
MLYVWMHLNAFSKGMLLMKFPDLFHSVFYFWMFHNVISVSCIFSIVFELSRFRDFDWLMQTHVHVVSSNLKVLLSLCQVRHLLDKAQDSSGAVETVMQHNLYPILIDCLIEGYNFFVQNICPKSPAHFLITCIIIGDNTFICYVGILQRWRNFRNHSGCHKAFSRNS